LTDGPHTGMDRRAFLRKAGGGVLGASLLARPALARAANVARRPNILVVLIDQMRQPQHFSPEVRLHQLLPGLARLRAQSVAFTGHYTAANMCSPARGTMLTGLYTHQTAAMLTLALNGDAPQPGLNPGFPTWGTMLRQAGYSTWWWGKFHVTDATTCDLDPWGFAGGTCPSPNGTAGQGLSDDQAIAEQFMDWLDEHGADGPWCTTVSFINPHDIAWFPRFTDRIQGEKTAAPIFTDKPPNFETPAQLRRKPSLQRSLQQLMAETIGYMPFKGPEARRAWAKMLNVYVRLQRDVSKQAGRVVDALDRRPEIAENTIVVFTTDHGEYGGSHGLRDKGGAAYDEAIRVPLWVKDPTGRWASERKTPRRQLTSSVDLAPLLLTLGTGSNAWRRDPRYAHLAGRADLATMLRYPQAPGRRYVLHTTDEDGIEQGPRTRYARDAPRHVIGLRMEGAKYATYSNWQPGTIDIDPEGQETECYDYSTRAGRLELDNVARTDRRLSRWMHRKLDRAIAEELQQPLPAALQPVQQQAMSDYFAWEASQVS
jgi:arylsulfatase A-like enzyme